MARYIPKSKVSILQTPGNKFVIASTNQPYQGSYMELSNGSYFAGNNPQKPKERLILRKPLAKNIKSGYNNLKYGILQRPIYNDLSKLTSVPVSKPKSTIKDYDKGYFTRYFCKRVNSQLDYIEIDKKTYDTLVSQDPKYDFNLYEVGNIKWTLLETPNKSVEEINNININLLSKTYPFLNILFDNLNEYEPLHTKYFSETLSTINKNKITPYTGYFHQHPEEGFMEGPFHSSKFHRKLYTNLQIQNKKKLTTDKFGSSVSSIKKVSTKTSFSNSNDKKGGY